MKQQDDEMKRIIDGEYDHIEVPEGLQERLSAKIDALAAMDADSPIAAKASGRRPSFWIRSISIAATLVLLAVATLMIFPKKSNNEIMIADTCTSVEEAYDEAQAVLSLISNAFGKGMETVNVKAGSAMKSASSVNKYVSLNQ